MPNRRGVNDSPAADRYCTTEIEIMSISSGLSTPGEASLSLTHSEGPRRRKCALSASTATPPLRVIERQDGPLSDHHNLQLPGGALHQQQQYGSSEAVDIESNCSTVRSRRRGKHDQHAVGTFLGDDNSLRPPSPTNSYMSSRSHTSHSSISSQYENKWYSFANTLPSLLRRAYVFFFLKLVDRDDTFPLGMRKLLITTGFLWAPFAIGLALYWLLSGLQDGTDSSFTTGRILAIVGALFLALVAFIPPYFRVRRTKDATDAVIDYWILSMTASFLLIGLGVPHFPSTTGCFSIMVCSLASSPTRLKCILHGAVIFSVWFVVGYNTNLNGTTLPLFTVKDVHIGPPGERIVLVILGMFMGLFIVLALCLQAKESDNQLTRADNAVDMAVTVARMLKRYDTDGVEETLDAYGQDDQVHHKLVDGFKKINGAILSFSRYVPRDVVKDLMKSGRQCELGMCEMDCVVMFSDIANFTSICERLLPEALMDLLALYFDRMTTSVADHHGVVDKMIGDAVMALWGAPRMLEGKELFASLCALEMIHATQHGELLLAFAREEEQLSIRVGLHAGAVLAGNVGSPTRMSYTVLGDNVNLASRLEGLNKEFGTAVMASESIVDAIPASMLCSRLLGSVAVVGKEVPVNVYELLGIYPSAEAELNKLACQNDGTEASTATQLVAPAGTRNRSGSASVAFVLAEENDNTDGTATNANGQRHAEAERLPFPVNRKVKEAVKNAKNHSTVYPEDRRFAAVYSKAAEAYLRRDCATAMKLLKTLTDSNYGTNYEHDLSVVRLLNRCEESLLLKPSDSFDPVIRVETK